MTQYLYPQNLKATANLWLWSLRDFVIMGIAALLAIVIWVQFGLVLPTALVLCYGFLTIRLKELDYALDKEAWEACKSSDLKPEGKTAYGVKFSADGALVVLCGAVIPEDGKARISLIDMKPTGHGTGWLAEWLNDRYDKASCVVIDGRNGVDVLVDKISGIWQMKGSIIRPSARDVIASVGMITDAINEGSLTWYEKQEALNDSAITSTKRPISGGMLPL